MAKEPDRPWLEPPPRLVLDGQPCPDYTGDGADFVARVVSPLGEIHAFTNMDRFHAWLRTTPLADKFKNERRKIASSQDLIGKIGEAAWSDLSDRLRDAARSGGEAHRLLADLCASTDEEIQAAQLLISPLVGNWCEFYRDPNYQGRYYFWEGVFHIPQSGLGPNNDTLSSIRYFGGGLMLFRDVNFQGPIVVLWGAREVPNLGAYPYFFDNMTSSWWFWG